MEEGLNSVSEGFEWSLRNDIRPRMIPRFKNAGSKYENEDLAPTEYLLAVAEEYHRLMVKYDMYHKPEDPRGTGYCYRCNWFCVDMDYPRLLYHCTCSDCA